MADTLAIVARKVFDKQAGAIEPGEGPLPWRSYASDHPLLNKYLEPGDRIFLVTVKPGPPRERLWLVSVYEDVQRDADGWWRTHSQNKIHIIDITHLRNKLRFHKGKGLMKQPGKLANSLQSPRMLTANDIELLEEAIRKDGQVVPGRGSAPLEIEADEGKYFLHEAGRYTRSRAIALERLARDRYRCRHCGFSIKRSLVQVPKEVSDILHVHHVQPLHLTKETTSKLDDLVTLCPTCHAVAHAVADALGVKRIDLKLLAKHYPNPT